MLDWLRNRGARNPYSVDRLRGLYAELLVATDLAGTNNLGRRRIDQEDELSSASPKSRRSNSKEGDYLRAPKRDLSTAFRLLAATPAADKEGTNGGALACRDDSTVANMTQAHRLEEHLVHVIRSIGEVVAFGDEAGTSFRSDAVFEYFCEKSILSLLVDIAKAKPSIESNLHASTWSPIVKSQVLHTVSILVSNAQDGPSLYYLLSNNCVNVLIGCMLPLRQWADPALEIMIPVYIGLLKSLALHVAASPADIFTFLTIGQHFPLFSSTIEVAISAKSDSHARSTCLNLVVAMVRISYAPICTWISNAETDMHRLSTFVCTRMMERYNQMAKLLTGPVVDHLRCNALLGQLNDLRHQIDFLNQLLSAGIKAFNVQFCELFLRSVVAIMLENLAPKKGSQFLAVGVSDVDVIPAPEGLAQLSAVFFVHFWSISYPPLTRMLAVALFHKKSTKLWKMAKYKAIKGEYVITRELNAIVQSKENGGGFSDNPYRQELFNVLSGETGEWRFIPVSMLIEGALSSTALSVDVLIGFGLLPNFSVTYSSYPESELEAALSSYLLRQHRTKSAAATMALERASRTALSIFARLISSKDKGAASLLAAAPLFQALATTHGRFCDHALNCQKKTGVSDLFVDLTQLSIRSRYPKLLSRGPASGLPYGCVLDKICYRSLMVNPEILVRKFRTVGSNDVEDCRFAIEMALQFRATCKIIHDIVNREIKSSITAPADFPTIDWADDLLLTIGDLKKKPLKGTDLDLRGRMVFNFHAATSRFETKKIPEKTNDETNRSRTLSDEVVLRPTSQFVLVLDPTDVFVVKPVGRREVNRGTIICDVSLRTVIAFASDQEWLHIAIRNTEDVGFLIKNGNMALHFDTIGTSLIVKQYLERSQSILRSELKDQIGALFEERFDTLAVAVSSHGTDDIITSATYEEVCAASQSQTKT